jgi:hypothetical protein
LLAEEGNNPHGTGLVIKKTDGKNLFKKKGVRGKTFLLQGHADFLWKEKYQYVLGHVRYKTAGKQSDRNAHPFGVKVGERWHFGIHNGIIGATKALAKEFGVNEADVDSETFFRVIAKLQNQGESVVDAIETATHFISDSGNFAFAYMTAKEIFLWRNEQRPLCVFDARKVGMGRFFASTLEMFTKAWQWACPEVDIKKVSYFEAKPYRLYRMAVNTTPKYEIEAVKDLKHKVKPPLINSHGSHRSFFYNPFSPHGSYYLPSAHLNRQADLFKRDKGEEPYDFLGVKGLSNAELETAIFNTQIDLDDSSDHNLFDSRSDYLEALLEEERRRKNYADKKSK